MMLCQFDRLYSAESDDAMNLELGRTLLLTTHLWKHKSWIFYTGYQVINGQMSI
jgi:hypothetical protein